MDDTILGGICNKGKNATPLIMAYELHLWRST